MTKDERLAIVDRDKQSRVWDEVGGQIEAGIMTDCVWELGELQKDMDCVEGLRMIWDYAIKENPDQMSEDWKAGVQYCIEWLDLVYWIGRPTQEKE